MHLKRVVFLLAMLSIFFLSNRSYAQGSDIRKSFVEAFDAKDTEKMSSVVEVNRDMIPGEIKALLEESRNPEVTVETREENHYIAELMAIRYKDITGDTAPLIEVKKEVFNSKLSPPVRSTPTNGVHMVELPEGMGEMKNLFSPDNIIIKTGETVRWVNRDHIAHVFASMPIIGLGGIFSPSVAPGGTWEYTFTKPGEYYYICFIHRGMIGRVTVEGPGGEDAATGAPAGEASHEGIGGAH